MRKQANLPHNERKNKKMLETLSLLTYNKEERSSSNI